VRANERYCVLGDVTSTSDYGIVMSAPKIAATETTSAVAAVTRLLLFSAGSDLRPTSSLVEVEVDEKLGKQHVICAGRMLANCIAFVSRDFVQVCCCHVTEIRVQ
jgi:hypothetical protein